MIKADYNSELDVLVIEKEEDDDFGRSLELGGFILDLDSEEEFLGLEIVDASQKIGLSVNELTKVDQLTADDLEIQLEKDSEVIRLQVTLDFKSHKNIISSQYPVSAAAL